MTLSLAAASSAGSRSAAASSLACSRTRSASAQRAGLGHRLARLDQEHRAAAAPSGSVERGAVQEVGRRRHVAAGERSPAGRGQPFGGAHSELAPVVVERPELAQESMRLLQVIAEDLRELEAALPLGVHAVGPFDEAFVMSRTGCA